MSRLLRLLWLHQSNDRPAVVLPQLRQEVGELPMTGMVAAIGEWRPQPNKSRRPPVKIILLALLTACCIIVPAAVTVLPLNMPIGAQDEPAPPGPIPGRHVITLNVTNRADTPTSTFYIFEDYPTFAQVRSQYGAVLGLLIHNCSGPAGVITLRENNSKVIDSFFWEGHALIAMGSWHSTGYDAHGKIMAESWGWMENATMDWLAGKWQPTDGILVEHQVNQSLGSAQLDILYFVPQPIPEFSAVIVSMTFIVLMVLIARRWRQRTIGRC